MRVFRNFVVRCYSVAVDYRSQKIRIQLAVQNHYEPENLCIAKSDRLLPQIASSSFSVKVVMLCVLFDKYDKYYALISFLNMLFMLVSVEG